MHTAYVPPAEETWHMKWCVKYIFVTISVAHLCHGVTCAITRCSGMSYERNDSLWSENAHLLSHICFLNLLFLLVLWTIICANFWWIYLTAIGFGGGVCETQKNNIKIVSSHMIHSIKATSQNVLQRQIWNLNSLLEQKVTMF